LERIGAMVEQRLKRMEMRRRGLRMALEKVKRRKLHCLPSVRIVVLFFL